MKLQNEVGKEEAFQRFNTNVKNMLFALMEQAEKKVAAKKIKYYYLDVSQCQSDLVEANDKSVVEFNTNDVLSNELSFLNYYWAEYQNEYGTFRLCMFYKDFDCGTGNIHVLPGWIQIWKKCCNTKEIFSINDEYSSSVRIRGEKKYNFGPIKLYCEEEWKPIWDNINICGYVRNSIWGLYNKKDVDKAVYTMIAVQLWNVVCSQVTCNQCCITCKNISRMSTYSKQIKKVLSPELNMKMKGSAKIFSGSRKYNLIKWFFLNDTHIVLNFEMVFVKGQGFFSIYDGRWHKYSITYNPKGPNYFDSVEGKWKINYNEVK